jgi:ubiquinone/menaquinone biosynthesis C-methylase UbiE
MEALTDRQRRELEYHRDHAASVAGTLTALSFQIIESGQRRWWNAYWDIWNYLKRRGVKGSRVLVVGCGSGDDALYFARLGANVSAFDLSPDMLAIGKRLAVTHGLDVDFGEMPSEKLSYKDGTFDLIFARDILHHVDIPATMAELARVAKPGALFVADEIYSHSFTDRVRHSRFVEHFLYPRMQRFVYKGRKPYITADERKLNDRDIAMVRAYLAGIDLEKYFNAVVTRIIPEKIPLFSKLDRLLLMALGAWGGRFLAGRILLVGRMRKTA